MFAPFGKQSLNNVVRSAFQDAVAAAFPQKEHAPIMATSKFGDFQCEFSKCMRIAVGQTRERERKAKRGSFGFEMFR